MGLFATYSVILSFSKKHVMINIGRCSCWIVVETGFLDIPPVRSNIIGVVSELKSYDFTGCHIVEYWKFQKMFSIVDCSLLLCYFRRQLTTTVVKGIIS